MSDALSAACQALGLKDKGNAATRLLAMRIIDLAREGIHDRELLKAAAVRGLSAPSEPSVTAPSETPAAPAAEHSQT